MILAKTAIKSLLGNGLKTWLNVFVLSISFVLIIFMQGLLEGWSKQAVTDAVAWEIAGGQYWHQKYDPYDPFSLDSSTAVIPPVLKTAYETHQIEPLLIASGSIYPDGRMIQIMMKGIRTDQKLLAIPSHNLKSDSSEIPVIIGAHMASQAGLKENDLVTLRWRDTNGTFEAVDVRIAAVFKTTVPTADNGTIWLPLDKMQQMMSEPGKATILIKSRELAKQPVPGWKFKDQTELTKQTIALVKAKSVGMSVFYFIFLFLALVAIFDTQTLSIFRRQREIGTYVALGMTPKEVQNFFTLEGTMNALLAIALGFAYGVPFFIYYATNGIAMPMDASSFGLPIADRMYPLFTPKLIIGTIIFIFMITALVSYLPARKISRMNPTEAIRGKVL